MARKLKNPGFVTMAQFARKLGVSGPAVGKAVQTGRLVAYDGHGDRVPPGSLARKWLKVEEAAADWRNRRVRFDDGAAADDSDLVVARTRTARAQAELLELRLSRQQSELIPRSAALAASDSLGRAVGRALDSLFLAAGQTGGLAPAQAFHRGEIRKRRNDIADMLLAEAEETGHAD